MKLYKSLGIFLALAFLQNTLAQGSSDTIWLCREPNPELLFNQMYLSDTFPDNRDSFAMVDTGNKLDGYYINFDYQFGTTAPLHPGYAGFKIFWDYGVGSFYVSDYDSMVLWHKGPLEGHKVMMIWAQGSAGCGTPINYEYFGEYKSSPDWKRESFGFPAKRNGYSPHPDSPFVKRGLFELRMLIYDDSTVTTSPTSVRGDLKIDNIYFLKNPAGVRYVRLAPEAANGPRFFVPKVSGQVTLSIYSLQGEELFKEPVDVTAGKRYNVSQFARKNSNLPSNWIHCIQINGAGVNINAKLLR